MNSEQSERTPVANYWAIIRSRMHFRLRTFLAAVTVLGVLLGLVGRDLYFARSEKDVDRLAALDVVEQGGRISPYYRRRPRLLLWYPDRELFRYVNRVNLDPEPPNTRTVRDPKTGRRWTQYIRRTGVGKNRALFAALARLPDLGYVNFANTDVTDEDMVLLGECQQLRSLTLWKTGVGDDGLRNLSNLAQFNWLRLEESRVTDDGLTLLTQCSELSYLNLRGTAITDQGVRELAKIQSLRQLNISETDVTDASIGSLSTLNGLRELVIERTQISEKGIEQLRKNLPETRITWGKVRPSHVN